MDPDKTPLYKDITCPFDPRVEDLVGRLTLAEKCSLMLAESPAIERLDIPECNWWNECLHGIARAGRAVVYPQAIGLAATFDVELLERLASAIGEESRAKYNAAAAAGNRGHYRGLTFWTPNVNIFREHFPRPTMGSRSGNIWRRPVSDW